MRNIVFDFWGTLAYLTPGPDFGEEISKLVGLKKEDFHKLVIEHWFKRELSQKEFANLLITNTNSQASTEDIIYWIENPLKRVRLYEDVITSLERLNRDNDLYLVSDTSTVGRNIIKSLEIRRYFQQVILSCENRITKSEGLYDKFFTNSGLNIKDTLVVGNSPALDYDIPIKLGARAILIDREKKLAGYKTIHSLEEIE